MQSESVQIEGLSRGADSPNDGLKTNRTYIKRSRQISNGQSSCPIMPDSTQTHVHEFLGSTKLAEEGADRHNHRFAGVTSEAIPQGTSHVHAILTNTDFLDHHHEIGVRTGLAIPVGNGKHVHFVTGITTLVDGHIHEFQFATLIESPLV